MWPIRVFCPVLFPVSTCLWQADGKALGTRGDGKGGRTGGKVFVLLSSTQLSDPVLLTGWCPLPTSRCPWADNGSAQCAGWTCL